MSKEYGKHNEEHAKNPQVGDVWHEMLCMVKVVVARPSPKHVIVCEEKTFFPDDTWTWSLDKLKLMTVGEFDKSVRYGSIPGFWCECRPEAHKWAAKEFGKAE